MNRLAITMPLPFLLAACAPDTNFTALEDNNQRPQSGEHADDPTDLPEGEDAPEPNDTGAPEPEDTGDAPEPPDEPEEEDGCVDEASLVYLVGRDKEELWTFDPTDLSLEKLGNLECDASGTAASMSVTREGIGYVRFSGDDLYAVDLVDLSCSPTDYRPGATGFGSFGMGFARDGGAEGDDVLFVANANRVARLDTGDWSMQTVGNLASQAEITGTRSGELWAFLPLEDPAALVQLGPADGKELRRVGMPAFPDPGNIDTFAFAHWGGEFWVFVREYGMGSSTDVYRVRVNGELDRVLVDIGFDVVGAGVSTCVPEE